MCFLRWKLFERQTFQEWLQGYRLPTGLAEVQNSSWQHNVTLLSSSHKAKLTVKLRKYLKSYTGLHIYFIIQTKSMRLGDTPLHMGELDKMTKESQYSTTFLFQEVEASNNNLSDCISTPRAATCRKWCWSSLHWNQMEILSAAPTQMCLLSSPKNVDRK